MKACQISIFGDVIHKGFRFKSMEMAYKYGIKGFVRYKMNSYIWIEAEGEEESMDAFIDWCSRGPIWGIVKSITVVDIPIQHFSSFDIVPEPSRSTKSFSSPLAERVRKPFFQQFIKNSSSPESIVKKELNPVIVH